MDFETHSADLPEIRRRPTQAQGPVSIGDVFRNYASQAGGEVSMDELLQRWPYPSDYAMEVLSRAQALGLLELSNRAAGLIVVLTQAGAGLLLPVGRSEGKPHSGLTASLDTAAVALEELRRVARLYYSVYGEEGLNVLTNQLHKVVAPEVGVEDALTDLAHKIKPIVG